MTGEKLVGLFGGTFNPVHNGHIRLARAAAEILKLTKLIFIPSALPPHKDLADDMDPKHRLRMVRLAAGNDPLLDVSDVEVRRGGQSYTLETLRRMHRDYPNCRFVFFIGSDAWIDIAAWHRVRDLLPLADWALMRRPGYAVEKPMKYLGALEKDFEKVDDGWRHKESSAKIFTIDLPLFDISSTEVRRKIKEGQSVRGMIPDAVAAYIQRENLYCR